MLEKFLDILTDQVIKELGKENIREIVKLKAQEEYHTMIKEYSIIKKHLPEEVEREKIATNFIFHKFIVTFILSNPKLFDPSLRN